MGKLFIFSILATAFLAYLLNPAVPDGLEERLKYRTFFALFNAFHLWVSSVTFVTMG